MLDEPTQEAVGPKTLFLLETASKGSLTSVTEDNYSMERISKESKHD